MEFPPFYTVTLSKYPLFDIVKMYMLSFECGETNLTSLVKTKGNNMRVDK